MAVDPKWIRGEVDRLAISEGCYFDEGAGLAVCEFIETFCRQSQGRWAGKPIVLMGWQRDFLMRLFGWKRADGTRRYRKAYLEVAKKNGKSTLVSALVLYLLVADGEGGPKVYLNACDKDQAGIVFGEAARMVDASPDLKELPLRVINSKQDKRILFPDGNGEIIANSSIAASKDGLNPSGTVFDELHRQPDRQLWGVFEHAGAARDQPLLISITTAGESDEGPWHEEREHSEKVNRGEIPDTEHLGVVYRALPEDDIDDPATWAKANPSLGETIKADDFARKLANAKKDPAALANFRRLRLNIIQREDVKFLAPGVWDACPVGLKPRKGDECWAGLDLSSTDDLSAFAAIFGDPEDGFDCVFKFWLPEDNIVELEKAHRVPYRAWADLGLITLTDGNTIDYGFIRREVNDFAAEHDVRKLLVDPFNATKLAGELKEQDGLPVEFIRQGFLSLSAPTKELKRLAMGKRIRHGGNPVMKWMAGNAVAVADEAQNIKLSKKKSRLKIDGMAALVNAVAAATAGGAGAGDSVYEGRGVLIL